MTEVQSLTIDQTVSLDTLKWTITNPDGKYYRLRFYNPAKNGTALAPPTGIFVDFSTSDSESQIRSALPSALYSPRYGSDVIVTKTTISSSPTTIEIKVQATKALPNLAVTMFVK